MDVAELKQLISKPEWADVEHKAAKNQYPKEALASVSAFANTGGGYLIFGIDERLADSVAGVEALDKVQNEFIGILKDTKKFSTPIRFDVDLVELNGKQILVFRIYEARRHEKPVYLNGDMKQTYLRKGGRDDKATDTEIKRIVRDSALRSPDEQLLELDVENCFDARTLKWYRHIYERHHNDRYTDLYDLEFLDQIGLLKTQDDELRATLASVLMFGTEKAMSHILPRPTLDVFWKHVQIGEETEQRWDDRRSYECNLFDAWRQLSERFMYFAEQPFQIDETNLQRSHETPDYIGFREAAVNALVHQDYTDTQRIATVHFYKDASVYFNPGDSLIAEGELGKGGSEARNPLIMQTFHRIKLSDRAGSGLREVYDNWQKLDRPLPEIINDKARKTFQITLGKKAVVTSLQEAIKARIGVGLSARQASVFVHCLRVPVSIESLAESTTLAAGDIYPVVDYLTRQGLIIGHPDGYQAQPHFAEHLADLAPKSKASEKMTKQPEESDQPPIDSHKKVTNLVLSEEKVAKLITSLNEKKKAKQKALILNMVGPASMTQIVEMLAVSHRTNFKNRHLQVLMDAGLVAETYPDNPHHQDQAYYLTEQGKVIKQAFEKDG